MRVTPRHTRMTAFIFAMGAPAPVFAYMGPGIGGDGLGAALGVVALLLAVLILLAWYPLKRLNRQMRPQRMRSRLTGLARLLLIALPLLLVLTIERRGVFGLPERTALLVAATAYLLLRRRSGTTLQGQMQEQAEVVR